LHAVGAFDGRRARRSHAYGECNETRSHGSILTSQFMVGVDLGHASGQTALGVLERVIPRRQVNREARDQRCGDV